LTDVVPSDEPDPVVFEHHRDLLGGAPLVVKGALEYERGVVAVRGAGKLDRRSPGPSSRDDGSPEIPPARASH
jgi:hypothetical protein